MLTCPHSEQTFDVPGVYLMHAGSVKLQYGSVKHRGILPQGAGRYATTQLRVVVLRLEMYSLRNS